MHAPRTVRVLSTVRESSRHATLTFQDPACAAYAPGQFVMVWVPGVDEVPMALWGGPAPEPLKITVEAKGDCTGALVAKRGGDLIGVRGPYGNPFALRGRKVLAVVGGTGTVPLVPYCELARREARRVTVVLGGRSKEFLLLKEAFEAAGAELHVSTDDGSEGFHGRAPDLAAQLLERTSFDDVVTCGPERMMKAVFDLCQQRHLPIQASLERWMKCAVGVCDACLVDGVRLCREGPVLDGSVLARAQDFGRFERDPSGTRHPL